MTIEHDDDYFEVSDWMFGPDETYDDWSARVIEDLKDPGIVWQIRNLR